MNPGGTQFIFIFIQNDNHTDFSDFSCATMNNFFLQAQPTQDIGTIIPLLHECIDCRTT
jgi:hypothetical protein